MKAIVFEKYGPPGVLKLKELEKPTPANNQVLIRIHASSVVAGDAEMRGFTFPMWFWLPLRLYAGAFKPKRVQVLGQEFAGVIEAVGSDVKGFKVGDAVFAPSDTGFGSHVEYKCFNTAKAIAKKPAKINYEQAACVPVGGLNSLHYLRLANIRKGEKILINGAAGNIGGFAVQIAKHMGAEVTAVDAGPKLAMLKKIGADHVIDYTREDFTRNGETYDVIYDVVGKGAYFRCIRQLNRGGRYVIANPRVYHMILGLFVSWFTSKKSLFRFAPYRTEDLEYLAGLMKAGKLKPYIGKTFTLSQMADAHRYVETGTHTGNVVIKIQ